MGRKPMITKACPKCNLQVAVASKKCKCGHAFFNTRRSFRTQSPEIVDERRRTGRVKREKPNYYDSQEYDKRKKRAKKPKQVIEQQVVQTKHLIKPRVAKEAPKLDKDKEIDSTAARAKRRRQRKEEEDGGGDLVAKLTPEKQELASIILAEINRKLGAVVWRPL